jgi:hypothetical protein
LQHLGHVSHRCGTGRQGQATATWVSGATPCQSFQKSFKTFGIHLVWNYAVSRWPLLDHLEEFIYCLFNLVVRQIVKRFDRRERLSASALNDH